MKIILAAVAAAFLSLAAGAKVRMPPQIPIARLIANTEAYIKEHPKESDGYLILARLHAMVFTLHTDTINAFETDKALPNLSEFQNPGKNQLSDADLAKEMQNAVQNYRAALEFDPKNALAELGLASIVEQGAPSALKLAPLDLAPTTKPNDGIQKAQAEALIARLADLDPDVRKKAASDLRAMGAGILPVLQAHLSDPDPGIARYMPDIAAAIWIDYAEPHYLAAHNLAAADDQKNAARPSFRFRQPISIEAGEAYVRIVKAKAATKEESAQAEKVSAKVADIKRAMDAAPRIMSPIIFSLDRPEPLQALLAPDHFVPFDIDGLAQHKKWSWIQPHTALLVWDPAHNGKITSGHQLFGNVSFNLFLEDGYRALDLLDDNRDGQLAGDELKGLAVWIDANANGVSDPGEVRPIESTSIASLSTRAALPAIDGIASPTGLKLKDGALLPTYDWFAHSAQEPHSAASKHH